MVAEHNHIVFNLVKGETRYYDANEVYRRPSSSSREVFGSWSKALSPPNPLWDHSLTYSILYHALNFTYHQLDGVELTEEREQQMACNGLRYAQEKRHIGRPSRDDLARANRYCFQIWKYVALNARACLDKNMSFEIIESTAEKSYLRPHYVAFLHKPEPALVVGSVFSLPTVAPTPQVFSQPESSRKRQREENSPRPSPMKKRVFFPPPTSLVHLLNEELPMAILLETYQWSRPKIAPVTTPSGWLKRLNKPISPLFVRPHDTLHDVFEESPNQMAIRSRAAKQLALPMLPALRPKISPTPRRISAEILASAVENNADSPALSEYSSPNTTSETYTPSMLLLSPDSASDERDVNSIQPLGRPGSPFNQRPERDPLLSGLPNVELAAALPCVGSTQILVADAKHYKKLSPTSYIYSAPALCSIKTIESELDISFIQPLEGPALSSNQRDSTQVASSFFNDGTIPPSSGANLVSKLLLSPIDVGLAQLHGLPEPSSLGLSEPPTSNASSRRVIPPFSSLGIDNDGPLVELREPHSIPREYPPYPKSPVFVPDSPFDARGEDKSQSHRVLDCIHPHEPPKPSEVPVVFLSRSTSHDSIDGKEIPLPNTFRSAVKEPAFDSNRSLIVGSASPGYARSLLFSGVDSVGSTGLWVRSPWTDEGQGNLNSDNQPLKPESEPSGSPSWLGGPLSQLPSPFLTPIRQISPAVSPWSSVGRENLDSDDNDSRVFDSPKPVEKPSESPSWLNGRLSQLPSPFLTPNQRTIPWESMPKYDLVVPVEAPSQEDEDDPLAPSPVAAESLRVTQLSLAHCTGALW